VRALLVVLCLAATANAETRPSYKGRLDASLLGAPASFDPAAAQTHAELTVVELLFDALYRHELKGRVEPHLAATLPEPVAGTRGQTLRITLRKGTRFHDGSLLTAADVVASLDRARTMPAKWAVAGIGAIRAIGDVIVELDVNPGVTRDGLAALLALPCLAITKGGKPPNAAHPIGSGPFMFEAFDPKSKLALKAFDEHFWGRVYVDRLVLHWYDQRDGDARAYESDATQISARGVAPFATAKPKYQASAKEGPPSVLLYVGFGRAHPDVTGDIDFRRALDLALDRSALAVIHSGETVTPTREPVPGMPAAGDPAAAAAAFAAAQKRVAALAPAQLGKLKLEILVEDTRPDDFEIALSVRRALERLGVASVTEKVSAATLRGRIATGNLDLYIGQVAAPYTQSEMWWAIAFGAGGDPWAATAMAAGPLATPAARTAFAQRLPIVPLMLRTLKLWYRTDMRGLDFDHAGLPCLAQMFTYGKPRP
jgi:ABC-type transport system substrate-binding protein